MNRARASAFALLALLALAPVASARPLGIELWTDRGQDAVYQPGDGIQIKVRTSDDAYLLVYEIDSEGYVHLLFPRAFGPNFIEGRQTYRIPNDNSRDQLVVDGPTGEGYIVAIASLDPFEAMPWYLRPYDARAAEVGYIGRAEEEEGVTSDGRIVGDPFVAMERIRRQVLEDPDDREAFGTSYTEYYVHERVRYPRYMCYDCHRPSYWQWWDGFDPYYTTCSVFDFRVNWGWAWGPTYWFNWMPYYVYVVRYDCPPRYKPNSGWCFSSWDGWNRWNQLWSGRLVRHKSDPPANYVPPARYGWENRRPGFQPAHPAPPGFLAATVARGRQVQRMPLIRPADDDQRIVPRNDWRPGGELKRPAVGRMPARETGPGSREGRVEKGREARPGGDLRPAPGREGRGGSPGIERRTWERPGRTPVEERSTWDRPARTPVRDPRPAWTPRDDGNRPEPRPERRIDPAPVQRERPSYAPREGRMERPSYVPRETPRSERSGPRVERAPERPAPRVERSAPPPQKHEPARQEPQKGDRGRDDRGKER